MYRIVLTLLLLQSALPAGQEPTAQRATLVLSTVKRGDLVQMVRGLGVLKEERIAEVRIMELQPNRVEVGKTAVVDTRLGTIKGQVSRVTREAGDGPALIEVRLDGAPPRGVTAGQTIDGTIHLLTLKDVLYVGGPTDRLSVLEQQSGSVFRLEDGGEHAVRGTVEFGLTGRSAGETRFDKVVEIRSGLRAGDTVIVSDMSAFHGKDRVRLQ